MPTNYILSETDTARINASASSQKESNNAKKTSIWSKTNHGTVSSEYTKTYTSYSGNDMVAIFEIPLLNGSITHVVGELQTISYSMYNEKMPVRVLGDMNMKSVVFGNRTIAGSMVFTVFDRHWAHKMMDKYLAAMGSNAHILTDELPPINITISMGNEYGSKSRLAIYGVTFVSEGQTMSVQDMYTENTFEYMAKDLDYMTTVVNANAASKGQTLSAASTPVTQAKKITDKTSSTNNTPIDIPKNDPSGSRPEDKKDKSGNAGPVTESLHVELTPEDIKKGRAHCLDKVDKQYKEQQKEMDDKYARGELTKEQYTQRKTALKKSWQNCRKVVNAKCPQ